MAGGIAWAGIAWACSAWACIAWAGITWAGIICPVVTCAGIAPGCPDGDGHLGCRWPTSGRPTSGSRGSGRQGCAPDCCVLNGWGGTGPLITSKSNLVVVMKAPGCGTEGRSGSGEFRWRTQETRKPPGGAAFGSCYECTILCRRGIPAVPKSRNGGDAKHGKAYSVSVPRLQAGRAMPHPKTGHRDAASSRSACRFAGSHGTAHRRAAHRRAPYRGAPCRRAPCRMAASRPITSTHHHVTSSATAKLVLQHRQTRLIEAVSQQDAHRKSQ